MHHHYRHEDVRLHLTRLHRGQPVGLKACASDCAYRLAMIVDDWTGRYERDRDVRCNRKADFTKRRGRLNRVMGTATTGLQVSARRPRRRRSRRRRRVRVRTLRSGCSHAFPGFGSYPLSEFFPILFPDDQSAFKAHLAMVNLRKMKELGKLAFELGCLSW